MSYLQVKKIIKYGDKYICGICRKDYFDINKSFKCLNDCFDNLILKKPVIEKDNIYKCNLCTRLYSNHQKALDCFEICLKTENLYKYKFENKKSNNINSNQKDIKKDIDIKEQKNEKIKYEISDKKKEINFQKKDDDIIIKEEIKNKPKNKFSRIDAKYVCNICREKYFTKFEVEKCYDKH